MLSRQTCTVIIIKAENWGVWVLNNQNFNTVVFKSAGVAN